MRAGPCRVGCRTVQLLRSCLNGAQFRYFEEPGLIALGPIDIDGIRCRSYRIAAIGPPEAGDTIKARRRQQARRWSVRSRVLNISLQVCEPANQWGMCLAPVLAKRSLCQGRVSYEQRECGDHQARHRPCRANTTSGFGAHAFGDSMLFLR